MHGELEPTNLNQNLILVAPSFYNCLDNRALFSGVIHLRNSIVDTEHHASSHELDVENRVASTALYRSGFLIGVRPSTGNAFVFPLLISEKLKSVLPHGL